MKVLLALVLLAVPAQATDFWVDATNGSDQNTGLDQANAFRTISRALQSAGAQSDVVHVLTGVYDAQLGEVFPLVPQPGVEVVGEGDVEIRSGSGTVFEVGLLSGSTPNVLRRLVLEGGRGILVHEYGDLLAEDLEIRADFTGIRMENIEFLKEAEPVVMRRVMFQGIGGGIPNAANEAIEGLVTPEFGFSIPFLFEDCVFDDFNYAFVYEDPGGGGQREFRRCVVRNCYQVGRFDAGVEPVFSDCLFIDCERGFEINNYYPVVDAALTLERCTLAGIAEFGVESNELISLTSCIVRANGVDLSAPSYDLTSNLISDGLGAGSNGNIGGAPQFVDAPGGDYRLRRGSPCVDTGVAPPGATDLTGGARGFDGNLDLAPGPDMGALEHRTLEGPDTASLGDPLELAVAVQTEGSIALVRFRGAALGAPQASPFGDVWLPPGGLELIAVQAGLPPRTTVLQTSVPTDLIGSILSFQALVRSSNSPTRAAWTEPWSVTILP